MTLRLRLLLATAVAVITGLLVVVIATYFAFGRSQLQQIDDSLDRAHSPIEQLAAAGTVEAWSAIPQVAPGLFVAILDEDGSVLYTATGRRAGDDDVDLDPSLVDAGRQFQTVDTNGGDHVRILVYPLTDGTVLVVGDSLHETAETRTKLLGLLLAASAFAVALVGAMSWVLVRVGLRPLRDVETSAAAITDTDLADARVPGDDKPTEVGSLAAALNAMLDRLQTARSEREETVAELTASEARMRQFVADASHELRTPIAATTAYAELFEHGARDRPEDLERSMTGIRHETKRMSDLVGDLLLLARLDEQRPLTSTTVDLTEIVLQAADTARTIDADRPLRVTVEGVITVPGDPTRLRQVVDNLLANVRAHTPPSTPSTLKLTSQGHEAVLTVSDSGLGVSDQQLAMLTDRFFRVDTARARATGGSGLGLSIVRSIVESHHGTVAASHNEPTGLTMTVRLPGAVAGFEPDVQS